MKDYFSLKLGEREFKELNLKGYLKLKIDVPKDRLFEIDEAFRFGREIIFNYNGTAVKTVITSVDVAKETSDHTCKVFLGFAPA
jgi:hypothetical protein